MTYTDNIITEALFLMAKKQPLKRIKKKLNVSTSLLHQWKKDYLDDFLNNFYNTLNKIQQLHKEGKTQAALALCENPEYTYNSYVQSLHIKILIDVATKESLKKAFIICNNPAFANKHTIQELLIKLLIETKNEDDLAKALEICNKPIFKDNPYIQAQHIIILKSLNELQKALKICKNPIFENNSHIKLQHISILKKQKKYKQALEICNNPAFKNDILIQKEHIMILRKQRNYEKALSICNNPLFANNPLIQFQHLLILKDFKEYQKALELCDNPLFRNDKYFNRERGVINRLMPAPINYNKIITNILNSTIIDELEIERLPIKEWQKIIIKVLFYQKNNYAPKTIANYLKLQTKIYNNNPHVLKVIKKLIEKNMQKQVIIDVNFYLSLLQEDIPEPNNLELEKEYLTTLAEKIEASRTNQSPKK